MTEQPQPTPTTTRDQAGGAAAWPEQSEPIFDAVVAETGIEPEKLLAHD